jgi:hypothetical protein
MGGFAKETLAMFKRNGNAVAIPNPAADTAPVLAMDLLATLVGIGQGILWVVDGALRPIAWALATIEDDARKRRRHAHLATLQARTLHDIGLTQGSVALLTGLVEDARAENRAQDCQ